MRLELFVPTLRLKNDFRMSNFRVNETCNETLLNQFKKKNDKKIFIRGTFVYVYDFTHSL